jgi:hypothetical protein
MHKVAGQVLAGALTCFSLCAVCPAQTTAPADRQDWQKPTLVTLHLREVSAQQALESLEQQSGLKIEAGSKRAADQLMLTPINIDADNQPFWSVLEKIAEAADLGPGPNLKTEPGVSLTEGDRGAWSTPFTKVQGPFAIALTGVAQNATIEYGVVNPYPSAPVSLTLYICPEPKVPVQAVTGIHVSKCVDETGFPIASDEQSMFQMYGWPSNQSIALRPQNAGKIALIEGQVTVRVATGHQHIEVPDILAARNVIQTIDGVRISINQCVKEGPRGRGFPVQLTFLKDDQSDDQFKAIVARLTRAPPDLLDAAGKKLNHEDPMNPGQPTPDGWRYRFPFNRGLGPQPTMGEPVKLSWDVPTQTQEVAIPFSFKDVPLPGGKPSLLAGASPATRPAIVAAPPKDYSQRINQLVKQLGDVSAERRQDAMIALSLLPPEAFAQIEAAAKRGDLPPASKQSLDRFLTRNRPLQEARLRRAKVVEEEQNWDEQTALEAYNGVGRRDPKWDALALKAISLYCHTPDSVPSTEAAAAFQRAVEAGCTDPMVLSMGAYMIERSGSDPHEVLALYQRAHQGIMTSRYPAYRKIWTDIRYYSLFHRTASGEFYFHKQTEFTRETSRLLQRLQRETLILWPQTAREGAPPGRLIATAFRAFSVHTSSGYPIEPVYKSIQPALDLVLAGKPGPLVVKARFLRDFAWEARGNGTAETVTPQGAKLMEERLAAAEQCLQKAYELDPADPQAAIEMLGIELG